MPITPRKETDTYLEKLLALQHEASAWISHKPTKGELREKFLIQVILNEFPKLKRQLERGVVEEKVGSHRQNDIIWIKSTGRVGQLAFFDLADCNMIIEVKSIATASDMRKLEESSSLYKDARQLKTGIFCYSTDASRETVIKKFGFQYDKELDLFSAYNPNKDLFPSVDFIFSLDIAPKESKPYFIIKGNDKTNTLFLESPVITYFLNLFRGEQPSGTDEF
jgi:hypothetical protein